MKAVYKTIILTLIFAFPIFATAQSVIQHVTSPYSANPDIAFSLETTPVPIPEPVKAITFEVLATDKTIREVLQRWSRDAGWTHDQIHWTILHDFPVEGTASADYFKSDFKIAVRSLLSSTQTTDLPVQPCFYSNQIIRVITQAEQCDRTAANAH